MANLQLSIGVKNLDRVRETLGKLSGPQARAAYALALNDAGGQLQRAMKAEYRSVFDRPTNYIANSPWVTRATADKLSVAVGPGNPKKPGVDPQKILQAQEFGGRRADKRMEAALRKMKLLPSGMQVALPARGNGPYPGSDDGSGNFNGAWVKKLLAFLRVNADGLATMNKRQRNNALKKYQFSSNIKTKRSIVMMDGREWFVSDGTGPLGAGIWARNKESILLAVAFISPARYTRPLLSMEKVARQADLQPYLDKRVRFRIREAAGV